MGPCCIALGAVACLVGLGLMAWFLITDLRCGLVLLVAAVGCSSWRLSLGESHAEGGCSNCTTTAVASQDSTGVASGGAAIGGAMNSVATMPSCCAPKTSSPAGSHGGASELEVQQGEQTLAAHRGLANWGMGIFTLLAFSRGVFLMSTSRRPVVVAVAKGIRRGFYRHVLRRKVLPACCTESPANPGSPANPAPTLPEMSVAGVDLSAQGLDLGKSTGPAVS